MAAEEVLKRMAAEPRKLPERPADPVKTEYQIGGVFSPRLVHTSTPEPMLLAEHCTHLFGCVRPWRSSID